MRMIVDCHYVCYRALHSMGELSFNEKKVAVIFGFLKAILKLSRDFKTRDFIFCWDSRQSYRELIYPQYKNNRRKDLTDEERSDLNIARSQFEELRTNVLPYMGFENIFHQTGYEADDLIAWVAARFPDETTIVSADNDLFQLLLSHRFCPVQMWNFRVMNTEESFSKEWYGIRPIDWVKVKAIAGCSSDNIAGVSGVGEPSAAKYVAGILKGKRKDDIDNADELIKFNYRLVGLPYLGIKQINIPEIKKDSISAEKFKMVFGQYGFKSLLYGDEVKKWTDSFFQGYNKTEGK